MEAIALCLCRSWTKQINPEFLLINCQSPSDFDLNLVPITVISLSGENFAHATKLFLSHYLILLMISCIFPCIFDACMRMLILFGISSSFSIVIHHILFDIWPEDMTKLYFLTIYSLGAVQKIMWKLNKSIAKELLPTQPVDFTIEPWWGICLVNFTLEEFKVLQPIVL